ncbi:hypothetical protein Srot_0599 [Segniliparus rotundus DSM 44985]|uniref:Uncharacterized protein n=1 Tax=Segniliparus rotundus (strain ATCC BAA-972 / CDC 1076 / CIP 108378 / DSM 44985 / JCM 13578) TaxID=640132 RepID=D6ZCN9_SEGRD|nr:hypothetical protein Srot_0599 [Segniliparus rotundus DSM 44985]
MTDDGKAWEPVAYDAVGLRGRTARITADIPRDSSIVPSDLAEGVKRGRHRP